MINRDKEQERIYKGLIKMLGDNFSKDRDELAITILASHICSINEHEQVLSEIGKVYIADSGYRQVYPEVTLIEKAQKSILTICNMYGLNPLAAQKLVVEEKTEFIDDLGNEL
jgi:P27 family predicted phage terminase small subunit